MNNEPRSSSHFEVMLPAGSEPAVETNDEDFVQILVPSGGVISGAFDGQHICLSRNDIELTLECVQAVTVADLRWVEQHTITRVFDSVSHFIRLVGGGELHFAFSFAGDLLELSAERAEMSITADGQTLIFGPLSENS